MNVLRLVCVYINPIPGGSKDFYLCRSYFRRFSEDLEMAGSFGFYNVQEVLAHLVIHEAFVPVCKVI